MTLYELSFKLQHDCPFNELSKKHPTAVIAHWCNYGKDVLEITYDDASLVQDIQNDLQEMQRQLGVCPIRKGSTSSNVQLVVQDCGCGKIKSEISPIIEKYNCLEMMPTIYRDGWEWYRVIAFSQADIKNLFSALEKVSRYVITSRKAMNDTTIRETFVISTTNLLGQLTGKQSHALLTALERGYYHVPKKISTDEIAKGLGVPRTTYEEHLRKAESKVLYALTPYIQMGSPKNNGGYRTWRPRSLV
jgi:predicted DNA binding protein